MVVLEDARKPIDEKNLIGSFFETDDGRMAYFRTGRYREDGSDLEVLEELPTDPEAFKEMIKSKDFILSEKLSEIFRQVRDILKKKVEEANGNGVDSAD